MPDAVDPLAEVLEIQNEFGILAENLAAVRHQSIGRIDAVQSRLALLSARTTDAASQRLLEDSSRDLEGLAEALRSLKSAGRAFGPSDEPTCDLNAALKDVLATTAEMASADGVRVTAELGPGVGWVNGSKSAVRMVFTNLLLNSLQAIASKRRALPGEIRVASTLSRVGDRAEVTVIDNGPGVRLDHLMTAASQRNESPVAVLLSPGFTTKLNGSGYGLTVSRNLLSECGGGLEILEYRDGFVVRVQLRRVNRRAVREEGT